MRDADRDRGPRGSDGGIHTAFYANDLLGFNQLPQYWYPQKYQQS
jgi:hypothetical protein